MSDQPERVPQPAELATQLIGEFVAALINVRIYQPEHPRVTGSLAAVRRLVGRIAAVAGGGPVRIGLADHLLIYDKRPLLSASLAAVRFVAMLQRWSAGGIEVDAEVTDTELHEFFELATGTPEPGADPVCFNGLLEQRNCRSARLLPPWSANVDAAGRPDSGRRLHIAVRSYQNVVDLLQDVTVSVCRGGHIQFEPVRSTAEQVLVRLEADEGPLLSLARHDQYDAFTFGHSVRVAVLALTFARSLTGDRELLIKIGTAALLHDVGKALIPFEILHQQRRLLPEEFREMSRHPQLGAELLLDHHDSDPLAVAAAFGHHQTEDGRGYPRTLHRQPFSMVTEIIKICDVYEALTAARPYKRPMSPVRAYRVMLSMVNKFDLPLLRHFIRTNGIFPVGQAVELGTGEVAVVRRQGDDLMTPIVELLTDPHGERLPEEGQAILDLGDIGCSAARTVLGEVEPEAQGRLRETRLLEQ